MSASECVLSALSGLRILYVTHRFPYPPHDGARIRAYHTIRRLARHNRVTVAAPLGPSDSWRDFEALETMCAEIVTAHVPAWAAWVRLLGSLVSRRSASAAFFDAPRIRRQLRKKISTGAFDLVVVHCSAVAPYVLGAAVPKIMDFVDMDSQKWVEFAAFKRWPLSWVYRLEGWKLRQLEVACAAGFDASTTATPAELEILEAMNVGRPCAFFPNGVDLDFFAPDPETVPDPKLIAFLGRMDYFPNEMAVAYFVREVFPRIRRNVPDARFRIVGAAPTPRVRALAAVDGVEVTGKVADVREHVRGAAVTVAPLTIARGTQNKILESMAMGVPVVTTTQALKGIDAVAGEHLLAADSPHAMADAVCALIQDPAERDRLALAGRKRVAERHDWEPSLDRFEAFAKACLGRGAERPAA